MLRAIDKARVEKLWMDETNEKTDTCLKQSEVIVKALAMISYCMSHHLVPVNFVLVAILKAQYNLEYIKTPSVLMQRLNKI